jgi:hypothetical protein
MNTEQQVLARAIWFDDEWDKDFIDNAATHGILVEPFDNNTDGLARLRSNYKEFDVVILDAWGRIRSGSAKAEDPAALDHAKDELEELAAKFGYPMPRCIYSGYLDQLEHVAGKAPKFSKKESADLDTLFNWVLEQAKGRNVTTIQALHADVFAVFDENLLPDDKKWELIKLLQEVDSTDGPTIKANNGLCRTFIEPVLEGLSKLGDSYLPEEFVAGGRVNHDGSIRYLTGQEVDLKDRGVLIKSFPRHARVIPEHLGWMLYTIIKTPTFTGSHDYREKHTHYAHRALVNALCELLIWYHDIVLSKLKK